MLVFGFIAVLALAVLGLVYHKKVAADVAAALAEIKKLTSHGSAVNPPAPVSPANPSAGTDPKNK